MACTDAGCSIDKSPVTRHREGLENLSRNLNQLSQAAGYLALQAQNDHVEVVREQFSEMRELLAACEQSLRG
jgi:hypothetical protein